MQDADSVSHSCTEKLGNHGIISNYVLMSHDYNLSLYVVIFISATGINYIITKVHLIPFLPIEVKMEKYRLSRFLSRHERMSRRVFI